jgi:starch-binding outer membrane protein, SusD/RagB family
MKFMIAKAALTSILIFQLVSCKKFVEVPPPITDLVGTSVYGTNSTAAAAVSGIFQTMTANCVGGDINGISALLGLSADEYMLFPNSDVILNQTYSNSLSSNNAPAIWTQLYNCVYQANSAIEGITSSIGMSPTSKTQLLGESKFIRAFCLFYLTNIYGDIPLVTSTNYRINQAITRTGQSQVLEQVVADLRDSKSLLSGDYLSPNGTISSDRVRPNNHAASALLARVYLYEEKWDSAEAEASSVIADSKYKLLDNLNDVFLANNDEAILQLEMPNNGFNAPDGSLLIPLLYYGGPTSYAPLILSDNLVGSFESGDQRRTNWVDSIISGSTTYYYPFKYKLYYTGAPPAEYPVLLRLAEQYLIRAEARAEQNKLVDAASDLNRIRNRAGLSNYIVSDQNSLLDGIYRERRIELFAEYGHRWFDLKRTGQIDNRMSEVAPLKGGQWQATDALYAIPLTELQTDPNLTQNPGY